MIAILVGQALDDLDAEHLDVATMLRLVVERAWDEGYQAGLARRDAPRA